MAAAGSALAAIALLALGPAEPVVRVVDDLPTCPYKTDGLSALLRSSAPTSLSVANITMESVYSPRTLCAGDPGFLSARVAPREYCLRLPAHAAGMSNAYRQKEDPSLLRADGPVMYDENAAERVALARWQRLAAATRARGQQCGTPPCDADIVVVPSLYGLCFLRDPTPLGVVPRAAATCMLSSLRASYWDEIRRRVFEGRARPPAVIVVHADWPFVHPCIGHLVSSLASQPAGFVSRVLIAGIEANLPRKALPVPSPQASPGGSSAGGSAQPAARRRARRRRLAQHGASSAAVVAASVAAAPNTRGRRLRWKRAGGHSNQSSWRRPPFSAAPGWPTSVTKALPWAGGRAPSGAGDGSVMGAGGGPEREPSAASSGISAALPLHTRLPSAWARAGWEEGTARELARRRRMVIPGFLAALTGTPQSNSSEPAPVGDAEAGEPPPAGPLLVSIPYTCALTAGARWDAPSKSGTFRVRPRPFALSMSADPSKGKQFMGVNRLRDGLRDGMRAAGGTCGAKLCTVHTPAAALARRAGGARALRDGGTAKSGRWSDPWNVSVRSAFCAEPPGDTPTRSHLSLALLSGCVPVIWDGGHPQYSHTTWWPWRADPDLTTDDGGRAAAEVANLVPEMLDYTQFAVVLDARRAEDTTSGAWATRLARAAGGPWWRRLQRNGQRVAHLFTYSTEPCARNETVECDAFARLYRIAASFVLKSSRHRHSSTSKHGGAIRHSGIAAS